MQPVIHIPQPVDFIGEVKAYLAEHADPAVNDLPVINLLLFWRTTTDHYGYLPFTQPSSLNAEFQQDIAKMLLQQWGKHKAIPIGVTQLHLSFNAEGKVILAEVAPTLLTDDNFPVLEVLRGTIPYFMREKFNYSLNDITIQKEAGLSFESKFPFQTGRGYIN
jgi:hypothetical protein